MILGFAIGYGPTHGRWGDEGVRSMTAMAVICLGAAIMGGLPIGIVAPRWPSYIGQAVLAGTTIRLLLTAGIGLAYQKLTAPDMSSYMLWAGVFYLSLLAVEASFGILAVRRYYVAPPKTERAPV